MNTDKYKEKYLKYKMKYLNLQNLLGNGNVDDSVNIYISDNENGEKSLSSLIMNDNDFYEKKRIPSFCDRILYKGSISPTNYGTILARKLCGSDHLLVFGEYVHNDKNGILLTFNIDKLDKDIKNNVLIEETLKKIIIKITKNKNDYIDNVVLCFQESSSNPNLNTIIKSLVDNINKETDDIHKKFNFKQNKEDVVDNPNKQYTFTHSESSSWTNQNSRIYIIYSTNKIQEKIEKTDEKQPEILKTKYLGNFGQIIAGSKAAVGISFNNICYICCHLPIDVTKKKEDDENYMGNDLRKDALINIIKKFNNNDCENVILLGDLNFRIYKKNNEDIDQLKNFLLEEKEKKSLLSNYKEFGDLKIKSCKINSVSYCKI
jgi:hypothetical protein